MTDKPIKATLDSSDDSVKTQKPILIQLDDIPTPEAEDAGKVLGVDEEGKYELINNETPHLYQHEITTINDSRFIIICDRATSFDIPSLYNWLKANFGTSSYIPVSTSGLSYSNDGNIREMVFSTVTSIFAYDQSDVKIVLRSNKISVDTTTGQASLPAYSNSTITLSSIGDNVIQII